MIEYLIYIIKNTAEHLLRIENKWFDLLIVNDIIPLQLSITPIVQSENKEQFYEIIEVVAQQYGLVYLKSAEIK